MKKLYIVIPCYNEEDVLNETAKRLEKKFDNLLKEKIVSSESKIMFVNDGSKDKTWEIINDLHKKNDIFIGLNLSRNRGHQNALLAGLMTAKKYADMVISMDADLQDDIDAIDLFIEEYYKGSEIVYGVRSKREKDSFFKRFTAEAFYKIMKKMGVDIVFNHADYRLTSKRVLDNLEKYKEVNLFLRGIFPLIGFKYSFVYYERNERFAGESKYPLKKMLAFAFDGITSFSIKPIRMILTTGILLLLISFALLIFIIVQLLMGNIVNYMYILTFIALILSGIQILSLGVIGEYIGKVYSETKERPKFIIEEELK